MQLDFTKYMMTALYHQKNKGYHTALVLSDPGMSD